MRRKMLANALSATSLPGTQPAAPILERAGIDGRRRPETLTLAELVALASAVDAGGLT
jgi:16S rRNA A1518/A1519 N6-dimethyltransferase RsmA/KsgA/DIM1 with predicted DNA glycosylase/AP lyase activity